MSQPRIAACIPAYNACRTIDSTLSSIQRQSWPELEIVICVDPSTDDTLQRCREHARKDKRIRVIENSERKGWAGNVRETLANIRSDWWSVLPQDDLWHRDYLSKLWAAREQAGTDFSYCDIQVFAGKEVFGTQGSPDYSSPDIHTRLQSYYASVANPNLWHGLFPSTMAAEIPFPAEPFNFPSLDNMWSHRVLCRYRGAHLSSPMYFKRSSDLELQSCSWWWNNQESRGQRIAGWSTVKNAMLDDARNAAGDDPALLDPLELAMDLRTWSPALLGSEPEHARRLHSRWRPAESDIPVYTDSLRWLMASRCSWALDDKARARDEGLRASRYEHTDWRVWQNLVQQQAAEKQFYEAQLTLFQARERHPNQFQLARMARSIATGLIGKEMQDRFA